MAEKFFPFDAIDINGEPDRVYHSIDFADYFNKFIGNGVYPNPSTGLQVLSLNNNMILSVKPGSAFINGHAYFNTEDLEVLIQAANTSYSRKDNIVVQLDYVNREIKVKYKAGVASANPQPPALVRTSDIHELKLAEVLVKNGVQAISQADITDTRLNSAVCGAVVGIVQQMDTTTLFNQYQAYWNTQRVANENAWQAQMTSQENRFIEQKTAIDTWYASVQANIALLKTFDFDNIAELSGAKRTTVFNGDGSISESILLVSNSRKIADRNTVFNGDGTISVNVKVYKEDGVSVLRQSTTTTVFHQDGSITEVVA